MDSQHELKADKALANRIKGGIIGVLLGDALGLPVQFLDRLELRKKPVQGIMGYGTFNLPPGSWSDDGSLTLCLVESLCEKGYDPKDIGERFVHWYKDGHLTPFGKSFDIGRATAEAMERLLQGVDVWEAGSVDERSNGNGSLMRILPAAIYFAGLKDAEMGTYIGQISRITHGHPRSQLACVLYARLVKDLLQGFEPCPAYKNLREKAVPLARFLKLEDELVHFERIIKFNIELIPEAEISASGYVIHTLEAALWCLLKGQDFKETLLMAVNLGEDTDTVGAVTGGLAGIYYGLSAVPEAWIQSLVRLEEIQRLNQRFASVCLQRFTFNC